jgi:hypothetical protein
MEIATGGGLLVDQSEKAQKFAMSMTQRGTQVPITLPSNMFGAANRVVVPLRL